MFGFNVTSLFFAALLVAGATASPHHKGGYYPPAPQPSHGSTCHWVCPSTDKYGLKSSECKQPDEDLHCKYGNEECKYCKDTGELLPGCNESRCPPKATKTCTYKREDNFTAMKRKNDSRAEMAPREPVPAHMQARRFLGKNRA